MIFRCVIEVTNMVILCIHVCVGTRSFVSLYLCPYLGVSDGVCLISFAIYVMFFFHQALPAHVIVYIYDYQTSHRPFKSVAYHYLFYARACRCDLAPNISLQCNDKYRNGVDSLLCFPLPSCSSLWSYFTTIKQPLVRHTRPLAMVYIDQVNIERFTLTHIPTMKNVYVKYLDYC